MILQTEPTTSSRRLRWVRSHDLIHLLRGSDEGIGELSLTEKASHGFLVANLRE
jgi:hypothetical protein